MLQTDTPPTGAEGTGDETPPPPRGRVGVIDIGSNTVRLVVYDTPTRLPFPIYNEKAQCELGRGLAESGRLNPDGVALARRSLARFVKLAEAMGVETLRPVATAAVRDAEDGPAFVAEMRDSLGLEILVLSGEEEARSAALGVLSGAPDADGVLGDLGGGSLDLVALDRGSFGAYATLPLGHLRLSECVCGKGPKSGGRKIPDMVAEQVATVPWLDDIRGRNFYAVGGSWRTIARIFIDQTGHPLHVIDNYRIRGEDAGRLLRLVSGLSRESLEKIPGLPKKRLATLPCAATVMAALIEAIQPQEVVFSAFGMREGQMLRALPHELRVQDPLISACETLAERTGRFASGGRELLDWTTPLFPDETPLERRLRYGACLVSDIGWSEHPDYRAEIAFYRVLRLPFAGLTHRDRVFLAIATYVRYNGNPEAPLVAPVHDLLDAERLKKAHTLGLALRLANTVTGGAPGLLPRTRLELAESELRLVLPDNGHGEVFMGEAVERRLKTLAKNLDRQEVVVTA